MSGRISKRTSTKTAQRAVLAAQIESDGVEVMPCSYCYRQQKVCRVAANSSRCSECARRGRSCDGVGVASAREFSLVIAFLLWLMVCSEADRFRGEEVGL